MTMASSQQHVDKSQSCPESKIDPHLLRYMQTALAVAIIKHTPAGRSAQEHAEDLGVQYRQAQLRWRDRVNTLKDEVLVLKQQLLQHKWKDEGLLPKDQELSGTDAEDNQMFLTPPCSLERPLPDDVSRMVPHTQEQLLTRHASFLQSILTLSTITTHHAGATAIDPAFEQTAHDSIKSSLITLGDLITDSGPGPLSISKKMIFHMVQVIANLVDSRRFSVFLSDAVCDMVLCFAWGIISTIMINKTLKEDSADSLSTLVQLLARSTKLRPALVNMLVSQVLQVAAHLRSVHLRHTDLDLPQFQTCYHMFRSLEVILEQDILRQDKCLSLATCQGLRQQLDDCLLHVWEAFLPFAQYVWHIEGLLQYIHPETVAADALWGS